MESPAVSRASLVEAYISGLQLTEVAVAGAGKQCRIRTGGDLAPGEPVAQRYFFKSSHVDLLLATIGQDGLSGRSAAALADAIVQAAASIGAPYRSPAQVRKGAELAVAEIVARVRLANQTGDLRQVNRSYKLYRQQQAEKGEMATSYAAYIEPFIMTMVKQVAGRMIA
jgi:hypothetical protein